MFDAIEVYGLALIAALGLAACLMAGLPPCATEDSANCYWNARTMGNGQGRSFIDLGGYLIRL